MAQKPAQSPTLSTTAIDYTSGKGPDVLTPFLSANTLPSPLQQPQTGTTSTAQLLGMDAAQFSFSLAGGVGSQTVTFFHLPNRDNLENPLSAPFGSSQSPLTIQPKDHLLFLCFTQGIVAPNGTVVAASPVAIDLKNVRVPGPFLGANTFLTFQATVSANSSTAAGIVSGMVVGLLLLSSG